MPGFTDEALFVLGVGSMSRSLIHEEESRERR